MTKIFSIGTGNEDLQRFMDRLKKWDINCLVDLRSQPYSEYVPHFNRERLSVKLKQSKIGYLYFGDKLGGRPPEGFEKFRNSPKFKENIDLLLSQVEGRITALMCSEFDILKCHRRFIVSELIERGIEVTAIDKEGNAVKQMVNLSSKESRSQKLVGESDNQSKLTRFCQGD